MSRDTGSEPLWKEWHSHGPQGSAEWLRAYFPDAVRELVAEATQNGDVATAYLAGLEDGVAAQAEAAQAARAEVIAEIRAGVEGLPGVGVPTAGRSAFVSRAAVLALLPPTEPK